MLSTEQKARFLKLVSNNTGCKVAPAYEERETSHRINIYKVKHAKTSTQSVKVDVVLSPEHAANVLRKYLAGENRQIFVSPSRVRFVRSSAKSVKVDLILEPEHAAHILRKYLEGEDREHFVALFLDMERRAIGIHTVSIGTLTETLVHPREVFKAALLADARAIILGHNHPGGDATPSLDDLEVTRELIKAGEYLEIPVLDHIIVADDGTFMSMLQQELLDFPQGNMKTMRDDQ